MQTRVFGRLDGSLAEPPGMNQKLNTVIEPDKNQLGPSSSSSHGALVADDLEDLYDDEQDHTRCNDCKGSGYYVGFTERRLCPSCDGSGYV